MHTTASIRYFNDGIQISKKHSKQDLELLSRSLSKSRNKHKKSKKTKKKKKNVDGNAGEVEEGGKKLKRTYYSYFMGRGASKQNK